MMSRPLLALLWTVVISCVGAFQVHRPTCFLPSTAVGRTTVSSRTTPMPVLFLSSIGDEDSATSTPRRKRTRRKDSQEAVESSSEPPVVPELKPRADAVELTIQDVRDVVSGKSGTADEDDEDDDEEDDDDDEYEYYYEDDEDDESANSLEQLLADAREMRQGVKTDSNGGGDGSISVQDKVLNVLSTIVTVDFFVVCALLVWFLAGIFCSYVLKDDAVQIAFNGIFQPVVQPALGVLMIASAAGAVFRKEEDE